jgi:hypothetical protein
VPTRRARSFKVPALLEWAAAMAWRLLLVAIVAYLAVRLLARCAWWCSHCWPPCC